MIELIKTNIFDQWLRGLRDRKARARIEVRLRRLSLGNPGDVKPVGSGISEMRIPHGPGYRVYYMTKGPSSWCCYAAATRVHSLAISSWPNQLQQIGRSKYIDYA